MLSQSFMKYCSSVMDGPSLLRYSCTPPGTIKKMKKKRMTEPLVQDRIRPFNQILGQSLGLSKTWLFIFITTL